MFGCRFRLRRALYLSQLLNSILIVGKGGILDNRIDPTLFFLVVVAMKEDDLIAQKQLFLKSRLGAVIVG